MSLLKEINIFRNVHRSGPIFTLSTRIMAAALTGRFRGGPQKSRVGLAWIAGALLIGYVVIFMVNRYPWTIPVVIAAWLLSCFLIAAFHRDFPAALRQHLADDAMPPDEGRGEDDGDAEIEGALHDEPAVVENTTQNDHEALGESHPQLAPTSTEDKAALLRQHVEHQVAKATHPQHANPHIKGKGVRVEDILDALQKQGSLPGWTTKQLWDVLDNIGVPVRDQMHFKVDGKKTNRPGVHLDDLTKALGRPPRLPLHLVPDLTRHNPAEEAPATTRSRQPQEVT